MFMHRYWVYGKCSVFFYVWLYCVSEVIVCQLQFQRLYKMQLKPFQDLDVAFNLIDRKFKYILAT